MKYWLTLSDGTFWSGLSRSATGGLEGEVVFTTANGGYPQSLSDPSYKGQILVFAFPPIGIYGVDTDHLEGKRPWISAAVVQKLEECPEKDCVQLEEWLGKWDIPVLYDTDCRGLILHLRQSGTLMGRIDHNISVPGLSTLPLNLVSQVSTKEILTSGDGDLNIGILDFGVKHNIIRELEKRNCRVTLFPHHTPAEKILSCDLDGLVLSNGPGDPAVLEHEIDTIRSLLGKIPLFGICLGTQLLALACGAKTAKLPYGHRGANQPVLETGSGKGFITSQNHGYAIVEESLEKTELEITFRHLSDGTVEGVSHSRFNAWGVQFHPESSPGPWDASILFDTFLKTWKE
jgi:carbamoyl-phosphate synthase small subunit